MTRRTLNACLLAAGLALLAGCQTCRRTDYVSARTPCPCGTAPPGRVVPVPPAPAPIAPPPRVETPVPETPPPDATPPAAVPPPVRLGPPIRRDASRPPQTTEPPVASVPGQPAPKVEEDRDKPLPIDLPGFAIARPNVASGVKPFPDGVKWLKDHGYKTVLHLREPDEDNAAARRMFEGKGLKYLSLEASPARLSKELYDQFVKIVEDTGNKPLFVFDKDGSAAGGLWFLYFRLAQKYTPEKAQAEAGRLGLQYGDDASDEHKTMRLAVDAFLKRLKDAE